MAHPLNPTGKSSLPAPEISGSDAKRAVPSSSKPPVADTLSSGSSASTSSSSICDCLKSAWDSFVKFLQSLFCCRSSENKPSTSDKKSKTPDSSPPPSKEIAASRQAAAVSNPAPAAVAKPAEPVFDVSIIHRGQRLAQTYIDQLKANRTHAGDDPRWGWLRTRGEDICGFLESIPDVQERFFACDEIAEQMIKDVVKEAIHRTIPQDEALRVIDKCASLDTVLEKLDGINEEDYLAMAQVRNWLGTSLIKFYIKDKICRYHGKNERALVAELCNREPPYYKLYLKMGTEYLKYYSRTFFSHPDWRTKLAQP